MLLIKPRGLSVNDSMCEIQTHGTKSFPFQGYINEDRALEGEGWHWHTEAELMLVLEGEIKCGINGEQFKLKEGEGIFINSSSLHMAGSFTENGKGRSVSFVFSPDFIAGDHQGLLYKKYVEPVIGTADFKGCVLKKKQGWQGEILESLKRIYTYCKEETWAGEMLVRNELSRAWVFLAEQEKTDTGIYIAEPGSTKYEQRVKKILEYIEAHYGDYITIEDMARQVNISRTECFRCFQKITGQTPLEYLTFYRLQQAAHKLRNTDNSITEICITSGFSHPSYFGKKFRQYYGLSPLKYRKQCIMQEKKGNVKSE